MRSLNTINGTVQLRTITDAARSKRLRDAGVATSGGSSGGSFIPGSHLHSIDDVVQLKTELERRLLKAVFDENFSVSDALVSILKDLKVNGSGVITNNLRVLGETYTYSADGIETFEANGGGAQYLWELADVNPEVKNAPDGSMLVKSAGIWQGVDTISIDCGNYKIV